MQTAWTAQAARSTRDCFYSNKWRKDAYGRILNRAVLVVKVTCSVRPCLRNIYRRSLQCRSFVAIKGRAITSGFPPCESLHGFMTLRFLRNITSCTTCLIRLKRRKKKKKKESGAGTEGTVQIWWLLFTPGLVTSRLWLFSYNRKPPKCFILYIAL